jgi:hypothetical protein
MKNVRIILCVLILAIATFNADAGKPGRSSDVPISMTFMATISAPAAITNSDPTKPYSNAVINYDRSCAGSHDATMNTTADNLLRMQFPAPVPGSIIQGAAPPFCGW